MVPLDRGARVAIYVPNIVKLKRVSRWTFVTPVRFTMCSSGLAPIFLLAIVPVPLVTLALLTLDCRSVAANDGTSLIVRNHRSLLRCGIQCWWQRGQESIRSNVSGRPPCVFPGGDAIQLQSFKRPHGQRREAKALRPRVQSESVVSSPVDLHVPNHRIRQSYLKRYQVGDATVILSVK